MRITYLDNAATTKIDPMVLRAMRPFLMNKYGNASEYHLLGQQAKFAVEKAREQAALLLRANPDEIIFTGSATESINLAIKGIVETFLPDFKKHHLITTRIEHKAVLESVGHLQRLKLVDVTYLPVNKFGEIRISDLQQAIRPETILVSVMYVNNEVGTIEPISQIGSLIKQVNRKRKSKIYFHTDATQAIQYFNTDVDWLGVDLLSLTGHKIYAPKGIGILYKRKGVPLIRQVDGGDQEFGMRAGTENTPQIVALGKAADLVRLSKNKETKRIGKLRDRLIKSLLKIEGINLTGHPQKRAPHIASFVARGVEGEALVLLLSNSKIMASSGSACTSSDLKASHVLTAMGIDERTSHGSIRFSLGRHTSKEDVDRVIKYMPEVVCRLRKIAPIS